MDIGAGLHRPSPPHKAPQSVWVLRVSVGSGSETGVESGSSAERSEHSPARPGGCVPAPGAGTAVRGFGRWEGHRRRSEGAWRAVGSWCAGGNGLGGLAGVLMRVAGADREQLASAAVVCPVPCGPAVVGRVSAGGVGQGGGWGWWACRTCTCTGMGWCMARARPPPLSTTVPPGVVRLGLPVVFGCRTVGPPHTLIKLRKSPELIRSLRLLQLGQGRTHPGSNREDCTVSWCKKGEDNAQISPKSELCGFKWANTHNKCVHDPM